MNNSDNLSLVQGPSTVICMIYDSDLAITTSSAPYSGYWVWASVNTNPCTGVSAAGLETPGRLSGHDTS